MRCTAAVDMGSPGVDGDDYSSELQPGTHVGGVDVQVQAAAGGTAAFEIPPELDAALFVHGDRFEEAHDGDIYGFEGLS